MNTPKRMTTLPEKLAMHQLMLDHSDVGNDASQRYWHSGWNYTRVAQSVANELKGDVAKRVAVEMGFTISAPVGVMTDAERLSRLERKFDELTEKVAELEHAIEVIEQHIKV